MTIKELTEQEKRGVDADFRRLVEILERPHFLKSARSIAQLQCCL
jgi:hypothetical protein